jgi:hypothetical protein
VLRRACLVGLVLAACGDDSAQAQADGSPPRADAPGPPPDGGAAADAPDPDAAPDPADGSLIDGSAADASPPLPDGPVPDAAGPDAVSIDALVDPCASDEPATTVGCNGPPPGPASENTIGGVCTSPTPEGTCPGGADPTLFCVYGLCAPLCDSVPTTQVATGGCPTGFRCWNEVLLAFCYPDCLGDGDCGSGTCSPGGRCVR